MRILVGDFIEIYFKKFIKISMVKDSQNTSN